MQQVLDCWPMAPKPRADSNQAHGILRRATKKSITFFECFFQCAWPFDDRYKGIDVLVKGNRGAFAICFSDKHDGWHPLGVSPADNFAMGSVARAFPV